MTTTLNKISDKVRQNAKTWYENAGVKVAPGATRDPKADEEKAYANLKLMSDLLVEGVPKAEVASLQLLFASNPDVSVAAVIKVARDQRNDPAVSPVLKFLKETLLPPKLQNGLASAEDEAAEKARNLAAAKLLYESTAISVVLRKLVGNDTKGAETELESATARYEQVLGRKLNDDEKFE